MQVQHGGSAALQRDLRGGEHLSRRTWSRTADLGSATAQCLAQSRRMKREMMSAQTGRAERMIGAP
jgi:hypothetical protein